MEEWHAPVRPTLLTGTSVPFISIAKPSKIIEGKNKRQDFVHVYNALAKFWATPQPAPMLALRNLRPIYIIFYLFIYIRESISGGAYFSASKQTLFPKLACAPQKLGIYL